MRDGISADAECVPVKATDIEGMVSFAKGQGVDFVVVTPDDPLVLGMVDALHAAGGFDDMIVTNRAARLRDIPHPAPMCTLYVVSEREKCVMPKAGRRSAWGQASRAGSTVPVWRAIRRTSGICASMKRC